MDNAVPKQFLLLAGKPMVMHSMTAFMNAIPGISLVLVLPRDQFAKWQELCMEHHFTAPHQLVAGGEARFHSVQNALPAISDEGLVAVHDGARPLVSTSLIRRAFQTAGLYGNCIPVIPVNESIRKISGETNMPVDRGNLRVVQTPQVFQCEILKKAYEQDYQPQFTDDAMVLESLGETIHLTDGDLFNIKITHPHDLAIAEMLFESRNV